MVATPLLFFFGMFDTYEHVVYRLASLKCAYERRDLYSCGSDETSHFQKLSHLKISLEVARLWCNEVYQVSNKLLYFMLEISSHLLNKRRKEKWKSKQ